MQYFLLVYNRRTGERELRGTYPATQRAAALRARFAIEHELQHEPDTEVVVLGSESLETLAATHSRYFKTVAELASTGPADRP